MNEVRGNEGTRGNRGISRRLFAFSELSIKKKKKRSWRERKVMN